MEHDAIVKTLLDEVDEARHRDRCFVFKQLDRDITARRVELHARQVIGLGLLSADTLFLLPVQLGGGERLTLGLAELPHAIERITSPFPWRIAA